MKQRLMVALVHVPWVLTVLMCGFFIYHVNAQDAARNAKWALEMARNERVRNNGNAVLNAHAAVYAAQRIRELRKGDYTDLSDPLFHAMTYGLDHDIVPFSGSGYPDVGSFKKFGMHASHVPSAMCEPFVLAASAAFDDVFVGGTSSLDRGQSVFYDGSFLDFNKLDAACNASPFVDIDLITH